MPIAYSAVPSHVGQTNISMLPPPPSDIDAIGVLTNEVYALSRISSLEKKPLVKGKPTIAAQAAVKVQNVIGRYLRKPPMLRMSCDASVSWMRACMAWI